MEEIKRKIDEQLGMESQLRYYDSEKRYATLHYFSPTGIEIFQLAYKLRENWEPVGLGVLLA